jgi:hypothetical protein
MNPVALSIMTRDQPKGSSRIAVGEQVAVAARPVHAGLSMSVAYIE